MQKQNNFIHVNIPEISNSKIWVSIHNIVYIDFSEHENHKCTLHINEGGTIRKRLAFIKGSEILNAVNNISEPRTWE